LDLQSTFVDILVFWLGTSEVPTVFKVTSLESISLLGLNPKGVSRSFLAGPNPAAK
jgi:hypothetical protein